MKAKVTQFKKVEPIKLEPNDILIARLEEILIQAKEGDIRSMVFVGINAEGSVVDGWTMAQDYFDPYKILGGLHTITSEFCDFIKSERSADYD